MKIRNRFLLVSVVALGILVLGAGAASASTSYTVQPGDSMFFVAQQFGVSLDSLQSTNGNWSDTIYPGDFLTIPDGVATDASSSDPSGSNAAVPVFAYSGGYSQDDLNLLAHLVYSEARGEGYEGQVAVAAVALNRLDSGRFASLYDVVFEPWAFTATHDGQFWMEPNDTAYQAAQAALNGWDPSGGATFYFNPVTATSPWIWSRTITGQIGSHLFAI